MVNSTYMESLSKSTVSCPEEYCFKKFSDFIAPADIQTDIHYKVIQYLSIKNVNSIFGYILHKSFIHSLYYNTQNELQTNNYYRALYIETFRFAYPRQWMSSGTQLEFRTLAV